MPSLGLLLPAAVIIAVGALVGVIQRKRLTVDRMIMGVVRDIGRYKAMKRRFGTHGQNSQGLIPILLRQDDPLRELMLLMEQEATGLGKNVDNGRQDYVSRLDDLPTYTLDELFEYGDGIAERPILIGILGRVYDVSAGYKFYGPDGTYGDFAGHDITYALSTGCRTLECLETQATARNLTPTEQKEGQRWLAFFHLHDKYRLVGKLESDDFLEQMMNDMITEESQRSKQPGKSEKGKLLPPILIKG